MNTQHEDIEHPLELLAPAGSWEAFKAAIENGADAVYLGGKNFSARANAANFDDEELAEAVKYAHEREAKVYVTVNTIVADQEFDELIEYIYKLYHMGVDAVILQDLGVAHFLQSVLPELQIHASTQMTVNTSWGVKILEEMGFERVVLARETSLEDMREISRQTEAELEVFVHGALCVCYSGQCLMSSFIGGRSGNRGTCAQPCRMAYQLVNKKKENVLADLGIGEYLLSPRDLNLVDYLVKLKEAGVQSLKIEGRMKRPEYVATVTRIYRNALDRLFEKGASFGEIGNVISDEERYELTQIFNREFTTGYLFNHPGAELMSFARPNNRGTRLGRITKTGKGRLEIKLENRLHIGDGIEIWTSKGREGLTVEQIWSGGVSVEEAYKGQVVQIPFSGQGHIGDRVFKTNDVLLMEKARLSFQEGKEQRKRPLKMKLSGKVGEKLSLEGQSGDLKAIVFSETEGQQALKRPLTEEYAREHLGRLGNTPFKIAEFIFDIHGDVMVPVRELNEMRRALIGQLLAEKNLPFVQKGEYDLRVKEWRKKIQENKRKSKELYNRLKSLPIPKITAAVSSLEGLDAAIEGGADRILLCGEHWRSRKGFSLQELDEGIKRCYEQNVEGVWALPRILNEKQSKALYPQLAKWMEKKERPPVMIANFGELGMFKEIDPDYPFMTDYTFNVFNQSGLAYLLDQGASQVTLSLELHFEQLKELVRPQTELLVFGDIEMMVSEYCPIGATLGGKKGAECSRPCVKELYFLRDRFKYDFPIETDLECRMHLYNVKRLNLYQELDKLVQLSPDSLRLQLIRATPEQVYQTVSIFKKGLTEAVKNMDNPKKNRPIIREGIKETGMETLEKLFPEGFTKGHFYRGVLVQVKDEPNE